MKKYLSLSLLALTLLAVDSANAQNVGATGADQDDISMSGDHFTGRGRGVRELHAGRHPGRGYAWGHRRDLMRDDRDLTEESSSARHDDRDDADSARRGQRAGRHHRRGWHWGHNKRHHMRDHRDHMARDRDEESDSESMMHRGRGRGRGLAELRAGRHPGRGHAWGHRRDLMRDDRDVTEGSSDSSGIIRQS